MLGDVRHAYRVRVGDEQAEDAAAVREIADPGVRGGVDAVRDEVGELHVGPDDAERAVAGAGQRARGLDDALQRAAQVEVGADADDRVQQGAQPLPAGDDLPDPDQHLLQQLVEPDPGQRGQSQRRLLVTLRA
ncbi:hypothetical protein GCM10020358_12240 [Amorphoplanes nipponensis]